MDRGELAHKELDNWFIRHLGFEPEKTCTFKDIFNRYKDKESCRVHGSVPYGKNKFSFCLRQYVALAALLEGKAVKTRRSTHVFFEGLFLYEAPALVK